MVSMVSNLFHAVYYIYHILISMVHTCNDHCSYYYKFYYYSNYNQSPFSRILYLYIYCIHIVYTIKLQHNYSFCNQFINQKRKLEFTLSFIYIKLKNGKS